jgi:NTE family protein
MTNAMTNALVLSAGGVWGAFQAGALSVVLKRKEYAPDGIFGSSAGALNGAFLADGAGRSSGPVDWPGIGDELVDFWKKNITAPRVLWERRELGELGLDVLCGDKFRGLLATEKEPGGFPLPRHPRSLFRDIVRRQIIPGNLTAARDNGVHYSPGTVDLFTGDIVYPEASDPDILKLIIASTAIPVAMDCVDVSRGRKTHSFVDGGTRDVAPLSRAIQNHYRNIICIVCQSQQLKELDEGEVRPRNLAQLVARLMNIVVNETVNNDLRIIDGFKNLIKKSGLTRDKVDERLQAYYDLQCVTIIRPEEEIPVDDMNFNKQDIINMIHAGEVIAKNVLENDKVFGSLDEAHKSRKAFGSFQICW